MESKQKRLIRYLNDLYAAEIGGLVSLKDLALVATDPQLKSVVQEHIFTTERQAERLRQRILALGGDKSEQKAAVNSLAAKGSSFLNIGHDRVDKQTQDLIKAYALEHFEVGTYTSLIAYARSIGDFETAALGEEIRAEEEMTAERLRELIPQVAVLAVHETTEFKGEKEKGGLFSGLSLGALALPAAVLAYWGISRYIESQKNENRFATASTPSTLPVQHGLQPSQYRSGDVDTLVTTGATNSGTSLVGNTGTTLGTSGDVMVSSESVPSTYSQDRDLPNYSGEMAQDPARPASLD